MTDIKVKCSACGHFTRISGTEQNRAYEQGRADAIDEVMAVVKTKISEREYSLFTMIELTDLGSRIEQLKEQE